MKKTRKVVSFDSEASHYLPRGNWDSICSWDVSLKLTELKHENTNVKLKASRNFGVALKCNYYETTREPHLIYICSESTDDSCKFAGLLSHRTLKYGS